MKQVTCPDCGANYAANVLSCPTCGCPNDNLESSNENSQQQQEAQEQDIVSDSTDDFNEERLYSPFSSTSWFFKTPWPLSHYPERKTFDEAHPFLGWLFGPWHLTCKNNEDKESYAVINNIFYLFNLLFKCQFYTFLWTFFKGLPFLLLYVVASFLGMYCIRFTWDYTIYYIVTHLIGILFFVLIVFMVILNCCGLGQALHRYWPSLHRTWRRINKRYWKSMHSNK